MMSGVINGTEEDLTVSELIETDFISCPQCRCRYSNPRILPCLHSFCQKCIEKIHETAKQWKRKLQNQPENDVKTQNQSLKIEESVKGENLDIICPVCKSNIGIPSEGVKGYPINAFLQDLCEMYDYKHEQERQCEYCKFDGKKVKAISLCLECQDNMCQNCSDAHHRTKVTRGHKVIPYAKAEMGLYDTDIRDYQQQKCPKHQENHLTMFCEKCEVLMCNVCKVSNHDNHKWKSMEEAVPKYQIQIRNLLRGIRQQIPSIQEYINFLRNYSKSVELSKEKTISNIQQQTEYLHQMIETQKNNMIDAVKSACLQERSEIEAKEENLKTAAASLQSNASYLGQLVNLGKPDEILLLHAEITRRLTQLMHMQLDGISTKLRMNFGPGNSSEQNIKTVLGKLNIDHTSLGQTRQACAEGLTITTILPNVKNTADLMVSFDSEGHSDGKDVWPTGLALTKSNQIVIVDRDNKTVKVYSDQGKLEREITGHEENRLRTPFDVAVLKSGSVAVTDHESEDVKVFSIEGEFQYNIKGPFKYPRGITVNSKGEIIVVDCQHRQITMHDPFNGKLLRTIEGTDNLGSKVMVDPYYVSVTPQDNIIVTDTAAPNIKVFRPDGKYLVGYGGYGTRQDEVLQPFGVCCDDYGYIFIADNKNHRIHLLLPDGKFSKFLLTKNESLWHPMGLAINQKGHLVLTEALGKVKVYQYI